MVWTKKDSLVAIIIPIVAFLATFSTVKLWPRPVVITVNLPCLTCHRNVVDEKVAKNQDIQNFHKRHIESQRMEYQGRQRICITCHEEWSEELKEVTQIAYWGGIYHPETALKPTKYWHNQIRRLGPMPVLAANIALHNQNPYTFKPGLNKLVCVECHGPDSKIKILYGVGADNVPSNKGERAK